APQKQFSTGNGPGGIAVSDFNGDSILDIATAEFGFVILGNGDGEFQSPVKTFDFPVASSIAAGDADEDGRMDFAVTSDTAEAVVGVFINAVNANRTSMP